MINKKYKDRLFAFIFGREENKAWTLELYNALNGSSYTDPNEIEITTLEDVLYMSMKNDVSILLQDRLSLYEQQSTYNPNMPVRQLMYIGKLYDSYIERHSYNRYGTKIIPLPVPKLYVFYNGAKDIEDEILYLSDAFPDNVDLNEADITVRVHLYNINKGHNKGIKDSCKPLSEYAWLVDTIRENKKSMALEAAVDAAIEKMPKDFVIYSFLYKNRSEVKMNSLTEYDEEATMEMFKRDAREEGWEEGRSEGENLVVTLMQKLYGAGRAKDAERAASDEAYRKELYKEFNLV